ncbi:MAG: hypothetical protein U0835_12800 [Isosphaeraceae bacterium]
MTGIPMPGRRVGRGAWVLLAAALMGLAAAPGPARADWWGFGMGGFNTVPSPTTFINDHSLINAANATRGPVQNNVYAGNPNAYINRVRDNGIIPRFDVTRRVPTTSSPSYVSPGERTVAQAASPKPAADPANAKGARAPDPLPSFFDASLRLVWPSDAPVLGELQQKRDVSDDQSRVVLSELKSKGAATIASIALSRQKLLDYGRPALRMMRETTTPRVADLFNVFLLNLYDSLAQAGNPDGPPPFTR